MAEDDGVGSRKSFKGHERERERTSESIEGRYGDMMAFATNI